MARRFRLVAPLAGLLLASLAVAPRARATVDMQKEAKKLGFPVKNCLYCHASPHAAEKMKERARELNIREGNCLVCHGTDIPATLNERGKWLVGEKARRKAERFSMAWLADYVPPGKKVGAAEEEPPPQE